VVDVGAGMAGFSESGIARCALWWATSIQAAVIACARRYGGWAVSLKSVSRRGFRPWVASGGIGEGIGEERVLDRRCATANYRPAPS